MTYLLDDEVYLEERVEEAIDAAIEDLGVLNTTLMPESLIAQLETVITEFEGWEEFLIQDAQEKKEEYADWLYSQMKDGELQ